MQDRQLMDGSDSRVGSGSAWHDGGVQLLRSAYSASI
jgi:hypothetical protein